VWAAHLVHQVFFLHIPKTAGSSITELVKQQYRPEEICPYYHRSHLAGGEVQPSWRLLWGHLPLELRTKLRSPFVFTFLRDPVERFISEYHYVRACREEIESQGCATWASHLIEPYGQLSLEEVAEDSRLSKLRLNLQTVWLAGFDGTEEILADLSWSSLCEKASANLATLDFVGFTDAAEQSVDFLAGCCGWSFAVEVPRIKSNPARPPHGWCSALPPDLSTRLRAIASADEALIKAARQRFA
jgi:hypothetical protein